LTSFQLDAHLWRQQSGGPMGQLQRVDERDRPTIAFYLDGQSVTGLAGDTILTAALLAGHRLHKTEARQADRAGFCLMGACQDCWVTTEDGQRLQACSTPLCAGLRLRTE
jgi:D-hydroxyproline dehydrogenase subunit gamma